MAYVSTSGAVAQPSLISDLVTAFKSAFQRRALYLHTLSELRSLSDRDLCDLGLSRAGLTAVAREAACKKN